MHTTSTWWGCFPSLGLHVSSLCPLQLQKNKSQHHPLFPRHQERTHIVWQRLLFLINARLSPSLKTWKRCPCWSFFTDPQWKVVLSTRPTPRCQISRDKWLSLSKTLCPAMMSLFHQTDFSRWVKWGNQIRCRGWCHSLFWGNVLEDTVSESLMMLIQPWDSTSIGLFCLTTACYLVASDKHTGNIASYNKLALLIDPIYEKFHERRYAKILEEGGNYCIIIIGKHAWDACREWFPEEKILNQRNTPHGSCIRRNMWLFFYSHWMLALHFFQVKIWRNQWLWARYSSSQIVPFDRTLCTWAGWTFFHSY